MENIEYQAGLILVEDGIQIKVPTFFGRKTTLTIKPLKPGTIVRIGMEANKLEAINSEANMIQELLSKSDNIKCMAAIVAHALVNQEITKKWKFRYYQWLMLNKVENMKYLYSYVNLVYRQMSSEHFFFIMALTPAMNYLTKRKENTKAEKPFGEQSDISRKPSDSATGK